MNFAPYIGYVAGALTVISYVPQAIRAWKTKQVDDLSWLMVAMLVAAGVLWIAYGVASSQTPVILTNVATTVLTAAILVAKFRFGRSKKAGQGDGKRTPAPGHAPARESA